MPKGRTAPREVICARCQHPFVTDRCGKAALYCGRPECDALRERQERQVVVDRKRERKSRMRRIAKQRTLFDPVRECESAVLLVEEVIAAALMTAKMDGTRRSVHAAIVRLAHAQGVEDTHTRAVELASAALSYAGSIPRPGIRDPRDWDEDIEA